MPNPDAMFRLSPVMARYLLERTGEPQLAAIEMFEAGDVESLQVLEQELAKDNPWMTKNVRLALEQSAIYGLNTGHPGMREFATSWLERMGQSPERMLKSFALVPGVLNEEKKKAMLDWVAPWLDAHPEQRKALVDKPLFALLKKANSHRLNDDQFARIGLFLATSPNALPEAPLGRGVLALMVQSNDQNNFRLFSILSKNTAQEAISKEADAIVEHAMNARQPLNFWLTRHMVRHEWLSTPTLRRLALDQVLAPNNNATDYGDMLASHYKAIQNDDVVAEAQVVLKAGVDPNAINPSSGKSLVHHAISHRSVEFLRILAAQGADLQQPFHPPSGGPPLSTQALLDSDDMGMLNDVGVDKVAQLIAVDKSRRDTNRLLQDLHIAAKVTP